MRISIPYLENIHHVLLIGKKSADLTNQLTDCLHSLRAGLRLSNTPIRLLLSSKRD